MGIYTMKKAILAIFILIPVFLTFWCTKRSESTPPVTVEAVSVDTIAIFPYVAFNVPAHTTELYEYIKNFLDEVEAQQIIPTGPLFILAGDSTQDHWALCFPIAEGTIVKEPLTVQKWTFAEVVKLKTIGSLKHIGLLEQKAKTKVDSLLNDSLYLGSPVAIRMIRYSATDFNPYRFQSEVWIPISHN